MHLLPCSHCDADIRVAPSQAGDQVICSHCEQPVVVPRLGQIRQLPRAEEEKNSKLADSSVAESAMPLSRRVVFAVAGLVAVGSLLVAGYCGIRWALIEVPSTTEQHIQDVRKVLMEAPPANLVRNYEDMELYGLEVAVPYNYKLIEWERQGWGNRAMVAAIIALIAILTAAAAAAIGRRNRSIA